jgi:hypothetical protein|tara:strand:+ start:901 stop:1149 length:249 start_codon:yes stop_codon:yes gene_type:complete
MEKHPLNAIYNTLMDNHAKLLNLLDSEAKEKNIDDSEEMLEFLNQLMIYLGSLRKVIFTEEELKERDEFKKEIMNLLNVNQA